MQNRLYRSPTDKVIGGVAGGLAVWLNLDPSLVRIGWVLLTIFSGGIFALVYFVMLFVVPLAPPGWTPPPPGSVQPGSGAVPGWDPGTSGGPPPGSTGQPGAWQVPPSSGGWKAPEVDSGRAGMVLGAVLVVLGAWFLVDGYLDIDWSLLWPVVVIVLGAVLIAGAMRRGRSG